jgi:benzoylformate decarboxylase
MTTVGQATWALLRDLGITTVFGNPGSTELRMFRDVPPDVRYVLALQEASAVAMADGFAQATCQAAFVNLHSAIGVGHAMGSIFTAMRNHTPLVITAGQQTRSMLPMAPFLFAERAAELPQPYVKWSSEPARAEDVPAAIARAHHTAMQHPRGPTFVSIPEDDWDVVAEPVMTRRVDGEFLGDPAALAQVGAALARSRRPALVVGPEVDRSGAWDLTVGLAERVGAAVWVSPLSSRCSFPEDHPQFAGFLTPRRTTLAEQLGGHDVVVVLGAPAFTYHVPSEGQLVAEGTELFQLVDDPDEAARAPIGRAVLTTLVPAIERLLDELPGAGRAAPPHRARPAAPEATDPMPASYVLATLRALLPDDAIVVEEAPSHRNAMHDHLPITTSGGFYAGASGGLGWALPAAVGVALGSPSRKVVCLLGDGSSLYSIQALWTAAQLDLPITFVILDNGGYAALRSLGLAMGIEDPPGVDLPGLDLVAIAGGFGCDAMWVQKAEQLPSALRDALSSPRPVLVDVPVDAVMARLY